ncbi:MAG: hypothetical protein RL519_938 [Pseudomonadota bacterium]|jgi:DNA-binding MarR family transcriptional regulator
MPSLRIINLLNTLRRLPPLSKLSGDEERLLFELRELWARQGSLSVNDVYDLIASQSASTSYRQLLALKEHGLVEVTVAEQDKRLRRVNFTPKAERLFGLFA